MATPRRRTIGLGENICIALLLVLLFGQLTTLGANTSFLSAAAALADVLVALLVLGVLRPPDHLWFGLAPVLLPLLLALGWAGLPEVAGPLFGPPPVRPIPEVFPLEWAKLLGVLACLVSGIALGARPLVTRRFVNGFIVVGLLWTLFALILRQIDPLHVWGQSKGLAGGRFTATLLNANSAGCVFGAIAVIATGRLQLAIGHSLSRGWTGRVAAILAICAMTATVTLAACALTGSRASLLLSVFAVTAVLARQAGQLRRGGGMGVVSGVVMLGLVAAGIALVVGMPIRQRFLLIMGDADDRLTAMDHFATLAARSPWFGYGLGSFHTVNARYLTPDNAGLLWDFGAAHSSPVNAALEAGTPFVGLVMLSILAALWRIASARRLDVADPLMFAQFAAVSLVFFCSLADIELSVPAVAAMTAILSGLVLGRVERAIWSGKAAAG
jgi:O-antigen ligase